MVITLLISIAVPLILLALALWLGGPKAPPPLESILNPFQGADYSGLPVPERFEARDKTVLAYRHYPPESGKSAGCVVLVHGSSSRSEAVHPLARALSKAGWDVFAPDVRGHGESGSRGKIGYIGQLEDDLEDLLAGIAPAGRKILMGFSSGGGFALRFASGPKRELFDGTVLLSPFLHQDSPVFKKNGGWSGLGLPRVVAVTILNRLGITAFNGLSVIAFALSEKAKKNMTPQYPFALMANFRPREDYRADIRNVRKPLQVLAGQDDEVFYAERFAGEFALAGENAQVTLVPGLGHAGLVLDPKGIRAVIDALKRM